MTVPSEPTCTQLRRRRAAAARLPRLGDGRHDPLALAHRSRPSAFGLDSQALVAEARRCAEAGWQPWEINARFVRVPHGTKQAA